MGISKGREYWENIFEKLSKHSGSVVEFCRENSIRPSTLYTRKQKLAESKKTVFQEFKLNEMAETISIKKSNSTANEIKIEIGKAKIYFSNINNESLTLILKEVIKTC